INQRSLSPEECYEAFKSMGINYGPAHKGLETVYVGDNEVLAKLALPFSVLETKDQFTLHPSLLDAALQASIGIGFNDELLNRTPGSIPLRPSLPFALESLEIIDSCKKSMWAWVRRSDEDPSSKVQKLDIDLCDEQGNVCVRMRGFSSRVLEGDVSEKSEKIGTLMLKPVWKEKAGGSEQKGPEYTEHRVFICGLNQKIQTLQDKMPEVTFVNLESSQKTLEKRFEDYSLELFANIQKILQEKPKGNVLLQVLVPAKGPKQVLSGLSGLLKTARLENPKIFGQVIDVGEDDSVKDVLDRLQDNSQSPEDEQIRYEEANRLVASFEEVAGLEKGQNIPWKEGGVYLITGGAGGLGLIFAKEIAEKTKNATLILTGRSELNEEKRAKLEKLEALGVKVEYRAVDVCDKKAVEGLI
ncbi:MAG: KR domain-containing protein, partial [Chloroflexi bacterium]|nr:KR domain-containing protein [Chloroflexota bacterium]